MVGGFGGAGGVWLEFGGGLLGLGRVILMVG